MAFVPLRGANIRIRTSEDGGSNWKLIDCEVDGSLSTSGNQLDASCKGESFDVVSVGRSTGQATLSMVVSDTTASTTLQILSKLIALQFKLTKIKVEFTEYDTGGTIPKSPAVYIRGDAYVTSNSWTFEDHQFVSNSVTFTFAGEIDHS